MRRRSRGALAPKRYYVGLRMFDTRDLFQSRVEPTAATHGTRYAAVMGPFRTRRGAIFYRDHGILNPHIRTVADAERIAKRIALTGK